MQNRILIIFVALFCLSKQAELPSTFKTCKRSADDFNDCLKVAIQDALPKAENGFPEYGFPKLQPLHVTEATVGDGQTGAVSVIQHYRNIELYNFTRVMIDEVKATISDKDFKIVIKGVTPQFEWFSDYDFNGKILLLPISGNGKCHAVGERIKVIFTSDGEVYEKNGEKYVKIKTAKIDLNPDQFSVELGNLFNGNDRLGEEMNKVLNSNWRELWADTKPNYESLFATILLDVVKRLFNKVPLKNIFPL